MQLCLYPRMISIFAAAILVVMVGAPSKTDARSRGDKFGNLSVLRFEHREAKSGVLAREMHLSLSREAAITLRCEVPDTDEAHVLHLQPASEHSFTLRGLKQTTTYNCLINIGNYPAGLVRHFDFTTARLPRGLRAPIVTVPSADISETGYTLYNYGALTLGYSQSYLVIIDAEGDVRWYHEGVGAGQLDVSYLGNNMLLYGGEDLKEFYPPTLMDLDHLVHFKADSQLSTPSEQAGEYHHDAGLSFMGDSVFTMTHATIDDTFAGFVVKEISVPDGAVLWYWDSDLDGRQTGALPDAEGSTDPYHANAVWDQWENGRLYVYVGLRDLKRVIKIDYQTRAVVWQLGIDGDFKLLEANGAPAEDSRWFFQNHDAKVLGNQVFLYDNGTDRSEYGDESYSRAVVLSLDEEAFTARLTFEYTEDNWAESVWGGFDLLPSGNMLLAIGHAWVTGSPDRRSTLEELTPAGDVIWRAEARSRVDALYRAQHIDGCDIFHNLEYCPELE